jgi:hypothetical protein
LRVKLIYEVPITISIIYHNIPTGTKILCKKKDMVTDS